MKNKSFFFLKRPIALDTKLIIIDSPASVILPILSGGGLHYGFFFLSSFSLF